MSLMFVLAGVVGAGMGLAGYAFPAIRNVEDILPDYELLQKTAELENRVKTLTEKRAQLKASEPTPDQTQALQEISQELREIGREYHQIAFKGS